MSLITLLTDFGTKGGYPGIMKGVMLGINESAHIVDITHEIPPFDCIAAAFVLYSAYCFFPPGTIHVIVVDPGVGSEREVIAVKTPKYIFLAPDNGVLSLILNDEPDALAFRITRRELFLPEVSRTFHGRDIFAPIAAHLSKEATIEEIGEPFDAVRCDLIPRPQVLHKQIIGAVIYQDTFGNLITNIQESDLATAKITGNLFITINNTSICGLSSSYSSVPAGQPAALFSSAGFLEIACNQASAAEKLGAGNAASVYIYSKS
jgi:hypothetical protein